MPLLFALWIVELRNSINLRVLLFLVTITLIVATISSVIRPQEIISSLLRLPPFTGGSGGAHASAYIIGLCALLLHQLLLIGHISKRLGWSLLVLAGILLVGFRVATPIFMLLNYSMLHILLAKRLKRGMKIILWIGIVISIVAVLFWHEALQEEVRGAEIASIDNLGSGRVGTWLERIDLISNRSITGMLFGSGPGSDSFYSYIWWWEKKDSHNDFITIIIESGILGFISVMLFLFLFFRRLGIIGMPLAWFLLSGSLVSNALLQRPIIATLFWLAVAIAALRVDEQMRLRWRNYQKRQNVLRKQRDISGRRSAANLRHGRELSGP